MLILTDHEKKVVHFLLLVLGAGMLLECSFRLFPLWGRALSIISNDTFYPKVNVNTASLNELVAVPHIVPSTAKRLIVARSAGGRFHSPDDLARAGLGEGAIKRVGKYLSF